MKYVKSFLLILCSLTGFALIITLFGYFNIISSNSIKYFNLVAMILSVLIGSIYLGIKSNNKGYLEGIKIGSILISILFLLSYFGFNKGISLESFIFYLIIVISSITGSIFGINKKDKKKNI